METKEWKKRLILPEDYKSALPVRETEIAIKMIKDDFQKRLIKALNLVRISAPLIVLRDSGLNDYLSGWEKPVSFEISDMKDTGEIVQSLAKWKRNALAEYGFGEGEGIYTDMNAIRPVETLDSLHSIYVDQWDWERVIKLEDRKIDYLKCVVSNIYHAIRQAETFICGAYPALGDSFLPDDIYFIHSQDLEDQYPDLTPKERENAICEEKGAVFIIGIGSVLKSGIKHDDRASDYDDWISNNNGYPGLNGDILVWNPILKQAFELSSMGIRVNKETLLKQLDIKKENFKKEWPYHQRILNDELPQTIGGGIGQSRLCMLLLHKAHVGEVQVGVWPPEMLKICNDHGIRLL